MAGRDSSELRPVQAPSFLKTRPANSAPVSAAPSAGLAWTRRPRAGSSLSPNSNGRAKFRRAILALLMAAAPSLSACGPFFPNHMLDRGDAALEAPYADFVSEIERMRLVTSSTQSKLL